MSTRLARSFFFMVGAVFLVGSANAAIIGYWQFDDFDAGTVANVPNGVADSSGNNFHGTGSGFGTGGAPPVYRSDVPGGPGMRIIAGVGGPIVNPLNTTSLEFQNPQTLVQGNQNNFSKRGSRVFVGNDSALQLSTFTIEAFVKLDVYSAWGGIANYSRMDGSVRRNSFGLTLSGSTSGGGIFGLQGVIDRTGQNNDVLTSGVPNQFNDDQWHHVAMTYGPEGDKFRLSLYKDYSLFATELQPTAITYAGAEGLYFGLMGTSGGFDGWLDEIRYSDTVLTPDQFLRVEPVPEPSSLAMAFGLIFLGIFRRRKV